MYKKIEKAALDTNDLLDQFKKILNREILVDQDQIKQILKKGDVILKLLSNNDEAG